MLSQLLHLLLSLLCCDTVVHYLFPGDNCRGQIPRSRFSNATFVTLSVTVFYAAVLLLSCAKGWNLTWC